MVVLPFFESMAVPAGLMTYPLTFLLSDLVTEIYGAAKARWMVYLALGMNLLALGILKLALMLPNASLSAEIAFQAIFGLGGIRIFASLTAYLIAQIADIQIYAWIKKWTGPQFLWLRNNASILISQLIDTILIDLIFLYWGMGMAFQEVFYIMCISYAYKALFSFINTPLLYLSLYSLEKTKLSKAF
jgi:hypothetical protein